MGYNGHPHRKKKAEIAMKFFEKHPMSMIAVGILGISLSSILVRYSPAPSAVTACYRLLWTMLLLSPLVWGKKAVRRELAAVDKKTLFWSIASGVALAAHFVLWFESLRHTSVASSTTIVCTEVIWVALGYCVFLKGRLSGKAVAAIALAFGGSILVAWADSGSGGHLKGDILSLIAAIAVAVYTLIGRKLRATTSTTVYTYLVYAACAATLLLTCLVQRQSLFPAKPAALLVGLGLAVLSTLLGHSIFTWCLKYFSPAYVSASKLLEPVVAAVLAAFLFGERPRPVQLLGCLVILGSVLWYSRLESREKE